MKVDLRAVWVSLHTLFSASRLTIPDKSESSRDYSYSDDADLRDESFFGKMESFSELSFRLEWNTSPFSKAIKNLHKSACFSLALLGLVLV